MKTQTIYICEVCGNKSEDKDIILTCEASHLGLTVKEKKEWDRLNSKVKMWERTVCRTNNRNTRDGLDSAVSELLAFEATHGMNRI